MGAKSSSAKSDLDASNEVALLDPCENEDREEKRASSDDDASVELDSPKIDESSAGASTIVGHEMGAEGEETIANTEQQAEAEEDFPTTEDAKQEQRFDDRCLRSGRSVESGERDMWTCSFLDAGSGSLAM